MNPLTVLFSRRVEKLIVLSLLLVAFAAPQYSTAEDLRIGLVDFARLQKEYYRTKAEREKFEEKRAKEKARLDEQQSEVKKLMIEQDKASKQLQDPTLAEERKIEILKEAQERAGKLRALQRQVLDLQTKINAEMSKGAEETQRSLNADIIAKIHEKAEAQKYDLILNRTFGLMGVPTLAYSSTAKMPDFTDEVLADLNQGQ